MLTNYFAEKRAFSVATIDDISDTISNAMLKVTMSSSGSSEYSWVIWFRTSLISCHLSTEER